MFQCLRLNFYFVLRLIVCEDPHLVVYILTLWTRGSVHTFLLPNKHKTRFFRLSPWQLKEKCGRKVHVNNLHYSHETDLTLAPEFLPGFLILFENLFWILSNLIIACVETLTFCINAQAIYQNQPARRDCVRSQSGNQVLTTPRGVRGAGH